MGKLLVICCLLWSGVLYAQSIPVDSVKNHVGELVTVCGKVYETHVTKSNTIYLNFGGKYPNNTFTGVIFAKDTAQFKSYRPQVYFTDKDVCVTGMIDIYKGKHQIVIRNANQIRIPEEE